jgi:hypothetical protein
MAEAQILRLINKTRNRVVCDALRVVDMASDDLTQLVGGLSAAPETGLWIRPCIGAPALETGDPYDLVGIDQEMQVAEIHSAFQPGSFVLFRPRTTSALVLASGAAVRSGMREDDELAVSAREGEFVPEETVAKVSEAAPEPEADPEPAPLEEAAAPEAVQEAAQEAPAPAPAPEPEANPRMAPPAVLAPPDAEFPVEDQNESMTTRLMRWLVPDKRKNPRVPMPNLVAFRRSGEKLMTYAVEDISKTGIYVLTDERPQPGTVFPLTLQKSGRLRDEANGTVAVYVKVLRWGPDGLGMEFITSPEAGPPHADFKLEGGASTEKLHAFVSSVKPGDY